MKKYHLNGSSSSYSLAELSTQFIEKNTSVWHDTLDESVLASEIPELQPLIGIVPPAPQSTTAKPSIHKSYWYNKSNYDHIRQFELIINSLSFPFIGCLIMVPFYNAWPLLSLLLFIIVGVISYKLYAYFHYRYFRIIKRTENRVNEKENVSYILQTSISLKKHAPFLTKTNVKWKDIEKTSKEAAEKLFDQKTIPKKIDQIVISPIQKAIKRPTFREKFMAKHNILKAEMRATSVLLIALISVLSVGFYVLVVLPLIGNPYPEMYLWGIPFLIGIFFYFNYTWKANRFLRVIERNVYQGRYVKTTYHVQSTISKKNLEKTAGEKQLKWRDYYPGEFRNEERSSTVLSHFNECVHRVVIKDEAF